MGMVFCRGCGKDIHESAVACPHCGARQRSGSGKQKTKTAAAIWAFFLGGIGAHKFYLGQAGLGILYLLFFWTFIPALIAFIEFILFLTMTDESFDEKYNV
ncbi:MAG: hypothetical protein FD163_1006 [Hyphomonadaceae bacterium]|nr:MAG: hypothetical protein FD128_1643 [Hyphomonadaceae bacterium]KAF0186338.1 MAG: hypothetical protein FD163_1006 [Hyphomonadaceae bacterium]